MGSKCKQKLGIVNVKISKYGRHIHMQNILKYISLGMGMEEKEDTKVYLSIWG